VAKQVLVWLTLTLLSLTVVYGSSTDFVGEASRRRAASGAHAANRPRDPQLAPREERLYGHRSTAGGRELDLSAAHGGARAREVRPHERAAPWNRLGARLFDYAIWGIVLALLLSELRAAGLVPDQRRSGSAIRSSRLR
jgi:hypothetical protein